VRTAVHPPAASLDDDPAGSRELIDRLDEMQPQEADFDVCVAQPAACLLLNLNAERQELQRRFDLCQSIPATTRWAESWRAA